MKPKIPKLTKKERRKWIKALKGTLTRYKNKDFNKYCLLCGMRSGCENCVWQWFTGMACVPYIDFKAKQWRTRKLFWIRHPRWVKLRLRQIPRWIKKLEEGL